MSVNCRCWYNCVAWPPRLSQAPEMASEFLGHVCCAHLGWRSKSGSSRRTEEPKIILLDPSSSSLKQQQTTHRSIHTASVKRGHDMLLRYVGEHGKLLQPRQIAQWRSGAIHAALLWANSLHSVLFPDIKRHSREQPATTRKAFHPSSRAPRTVLELSQPRG